MSDDAANELAQHVEECKGRIQAAVHNAASAAGVSLEVAHSAFSSALRPWLRTQIVIADGRANKWRVRVRLYASDKPSDAVADTDPDLRPDAQGSEVVSGLPAVASFVAEVAQGWHGESCVGLDGPTMRHKIKGLRPTLSRRGGNAVWRLPYRTAEREWLARVDIERVEES